jgi:isoleucyl-tRNA synthetase
VIGSRAELAEKATAGLDQLEELHRPWIDRVVIRCDHCGATDVQRIPEVGDVWLDAGIVPFSTLGWQNPEWIPGGSATGAAAGLTTADLPGPRLLGAVVPRRLGDRDARAGEAVVLLAALHVRGVGRAGPIPIGPRATRGCSPRTGARCTALGGTSSVLRRPSSAWVPTSCGGCTAPIPRTGTCCSGTPGPTRWRRLLTLWNSARFFIDYANIEGFTPSYSDLESGPAGVDLRPIDDWLLSRAGRAILDATDALERWRVDDLIAAFEAYLSDLSNWYIRRNRRRYYAFDEGAFRTLWVGLVTALRIMAPVMPFLTEHLWSNLVAGPCPEAPASIHVAGWPQPPVMPDSALLTEMDAVRTVVEAGRRARSEAGLRLRQPLRTALVRGGAAAERHADEIRDELRVKEVRFEEEAQVELSLKPNFAIAGPRLGSKIKDVAAALAAGQYEIADDGSVSVAGETLTSEEIVRVERVIRDGWAVAHDGEVSVALDLTVDDELLTEARVLDLIRTLNDQRRDEGLSLTDRIALRLPPAHADLVEVHSDWIAAEVLAVSIDVDESIETPAIEVSSSG